MYSVFRFFILCASIILIFLYGIIKYTNLINFNQKKYKARHLFMTYIDSPPIRQIATGNIITPYDMDEIKDLERSE